VRHLPVHLDLAARVLGETGHVRGSLANPLQTLHPALPSGRAVAMMSRMRDLSGFRRALLVVALFVPLVVDPFGADTQGAKSALLALCGGLLLATEGAAAFSGQPIPAPTVPEALLMLLAGWAAASLAWAVNPALGATRVVQIAALLGVARGVRAEVSDAGSAARWVRGLVAAGLLAVAVDAVLLLRARPELSDAAAKHASQIFVHNNMAADFATALAPLALAALIAAGSGAFRLAWGVALAGVLAYLGLLGSRAGLAGAVLGLLVTGVLFRMRARFARSGPPSRRMLIVAGALVLVGAVLPLSEKARGVAKDAYYGTVKLTGLQLADTAFRMELWRKTLEMAGEHPLAGVGAGNFPVQFPRFERLQAAKPHAHDDSLQMLAELGVPGLLIFLALFVSLALLLWRAQSSGDRARSALVAGLLGLLVAFVVAGLFEVPFALGATGLCFAWLLGLAGVLQPSPQPAATVPRRRAVITLACGLLVVGLTAWRLPASRWLDRAKQAAAEGRADEALAAAERVASLGTGAYQPEQLAASLELDAGHPDEALEHVYRALALAPWSSELRVEEGNALFALARYTEAVAAYEEAVRLTPESDEPYMRLQVALFFVGHQADAVDALEQRVRQDEHVSMDFVAKLAELARDHAEALKGDDKVVALVQARHWYAVVAQEDPARAAALDVSFRDLTHRLQILPGSPDSWFKTVYRRWLDQGGWGIPGPALYISLEPGERMLYPGWELPPGGFPSGSWRHPSIWADPAPPPPSH
jgi:O-antigen ligase/Flp pilus assembly protein TadD